MSTALSPDDLLTADSQARQQALDRASIIVEAPAGAGKTELLTQRFLALLPTVQDPEEIIALTFTNKAAAEMRSRIMDSLALAARGERPSDELPHKQITFDLGRTVLALDAEREWGLMQHPGRLQITTLDALCGRLARQMPFLSRFGAQPTVSPDAQPLYRKAARNTLDMLEDEGDDGETSHADDASPQALLSRVLAYFDNDARKLQSLLEVMLATRDQWLSHLHGQSNSGPSPDALARLVEGELATIASALPPPLQQAMMASARYAADMARQAGGLDNIATLLDWASPLTPAQDELPRWRGLGELLLTKTGTLRSRFDPALKLSEKDVKPLAEALKTTIAQLKESPTAEDLLARISQLPDPQPAAADWQLVADFSRLLVLASAQLWLVFLEERQVDFTEVAQNALAALGSSDAPSELRERLDYRISHLLVDEFQDTSPTQVRLLEQLTSDWQQGDGRTLFLVGDPMQSIYRFRKADVGLFLKVRQCGIGGLQLTPLRLYRNNRSHPELVAWVNTVFPQVFAAEDDPRQGAVKFAPAAPTKENHPQAQVVLHPIVDGGDESDDEQASPADQREAQRMVALLRQARQDDPEGSIAVLVRAKAHLQPLVAELRQAGPELAYQAVEIEPLDQRQVIQDLLALTRALHHRADRVNWLAILRAPWCGLLLADLHALAADDHRSTIWQLMQDEARWQRLSADGQQRLGHVRAVLAEAYRHQGQHRPRRWVEGVWQALGGPRCLQDASEAEDVTAFFTLLDSAEHKGSLDLDRLDEAMAKLFAAPDPKGGAIQLMTVHKSKGLEFDTVLLPGLHRTLRGNDRSLLLWEEVLLDDDEGDSDGSLNEALIVAPLPRRKPAKSAPPSAYDYLQEFEKRRSEHEGQRVLYVAVTRARRQLHLLAKVKPSDKEGEVCKAPAKNTALAQLWPALGLQFEVAVTAQLDQASQNTEPTMDMAPQETAPFQPWLLRLAQSATHPGLTIPTGAIKEDAGNDAIYALEESRPLEAHVGTLVHRYLEIWSKDDLAQWSEARIQSLKPRFIHWLAQQGHAPEACAVGASKAVQHLCITLASEAGRWLLSPHAEASSELALTTFSEGRPFVQVVDRSFMDQGLHWIVDYKTAAPGAQEKAEFIAEQIPLYREQLAGYAKLLGNSSGEGATIRCALFFTALGELVAVT